MGLVNRHYMHRWDCTCPACEESRQKEHRQKQIDDTFAAAKYKRDRLASEEKTRKDKEFSITLNKMMRKDARCKHSRPLAEGEKWEDTFCNILGTTCVVVKGEFCISERPISDEGEEAKNLAKNKRGIKKSHKDTNPIQTKDFNEEDAYNEIYGKATDLLKSSESWTNIKCPICSSKTRMRTVMKGKDSSKKFYVCINFPRCKGRVKVHNKQDIP